MFFPQKMTETQLIIPEKDLIEVTKALASYRNFYQVDANYLSEDLENTSANSWKGMEVGYAVLERRIMSIMQTLGVEESYPSDNSIEMIKSDTVSSEVDEIEQVVQNASSQLSSEQKQLEQYNSYLTQLEPVSDLDIEISELNNAQYIFSMLGIMPEANISRLETSLVRVPYVLLPLRKENEKVVVWLVGPARRATVLERAARSAYLNPLKLPANTQGTPAQAIQSIHKAIEETRKNIDAQKATVAELARQYRDKLQNLLWRVRASRMMAEAIAHYGQLQYTYLIVGWIPSEQLESLRQRLIKVSPEIVIDSFPFKGEEEGTKVPVVLNNPRFFGPFQQLVTMLAQPRYSEFDPTFLMAITFPLLFGAMFGDVGHGLLLAMIGVLLMSKKVKFLRGLAGLGGLVTFCGAAASLFGFLYGSVLGSEEIITPLWINPMENIMEILMIAIGAGVVLLSIGFILNMLNAVFAKDWARFFFDSNGLSGFILYWSLLGLAGSIAIENFPVPTIVFGITAGISGVAVLFSELLKRLVEHHRPLVDEGLGTYAVQVFFEFFETMIGFLSNTLSYVRVGAFAVAHGGLSAVFFILAEMVSPTKGVGYWIVYAIGTVFIVGFEGLIVGIQTMRLEYYEFFSKFFKGGGSKFKPLALLFTAKE